MKSKLDINKYLNHYLIVVDGQEEKVVYDIDDSRIFSSKITGCRRGARNAVLTTKTFLTSEQAENGIKYLDSCFWNFKFKTIKVHELEKMSKKGYEILLDDIESFNFDIAFENKREKEEKKKAREELKNRKELFEALIENRYKDSFYDEGNNTIEVILKQIKMIPRKEIIKQQLKWH